MIMEIGFDSRSPISSLFPGRLVDKISSRIKSGTLRHYLVEEFLRGLMKAKNIHSHTSLLFPSCRQDSSVDKSGNSLKLSCEGFSARLDKSETYIKDETMV
ncbi:hypothetical protein CEXT_600771 [Caerostris extrusa]|uniref:Uncharacterized protein n=1 Tax=Caerostris extrusa TaxID=172846 RepID=A0AAV4R943_CAEEX|nr:hypothetical protein CEXT_600771 [Caerostris extrusa]